MFTVCQHCKTGNLEPPANEHPSYVICDSCGAYHLTYQPQDYQAEYHETPYEYIWNEITEQWDIRNMTIATFGGKNP